MQSLTQFLQHDYYLCQELCDIFQHTNIGLFDAIVDAVSKQPLKSTFTQKHGFRKDYYFNKYC